MTLLFINGWKMKHNRVKHLLYLLLCLHPIGLLADEDKHIEEPSLDFLEFLGSWETETNEDWVDPFVLVEMKHELSSRDTTEEKQND